MLTEMQTSYHKNVHSSAKLSKITIASHSVFYFHLFPGVTEWPRLGIKHNCTTFSSFWPLYSLYLTSPWLFTQMITTCTFKHFYYWLPGHYYLIFINLVCWKLLISLTYYILKTQSSFFRLLFCLLSIASTPS